MLEGSGRLEDLTEFAREVVKPALEQVDGISRAEVVGGAVREILIEPDSRKMAVYGIDVEDIRLALVRSNISFPGGKVRQGPLHLSLRIDGEFEQLDDIASTHLGLAGQSPVRISDVARVADTVKEPEGVTLLGGSTVVSVARLQGARGEHPVRLGGSRRGPIGGLDRLFGLSLRIRLPGCIARSGIVRGARASSGTRRSAGDSGAFRLSRRLAQPLGGRSRHSGLDRHHLRLPSLATSSST